MRNPHLSPRCFAAKCRNPRPRVVKNKMCKKRQFPDTKKILSPFLRERLLLHIRSLDAVFLGTFRKKKRLFKSEKLIFGGALHAKATNGAHRRNGRLHQEMIRFAKGGCTWQPAHCDKAPPT